jgi:hypothetical protein
MTNTNLPAEIINTINGRRNHLALMCAITSNGLEGLTGDRNTKGAKKLAEQSRNLVAMILEANFECQSVPFASEKQKAEYEAETKRFLELHDKVMKNTGLRAA